MKTFDVHWLLIFYQHRRGSLVVKKAFYYSTMRHCNWVWLGTRLEESSAVNVVHV